MGIAEQVRRPVADPHLLDPDLTHGVTQADSTEDSLRQFLREGQAQSSPFGFRLEKQKHGIYVKSPTPVVILYFWRDGHDC